MNEESSDDDGLRDVFNTANQQTKKKQVKNFFKDIVPKTIKRSHSFVTNSISNIRNRNNQKPTKFKYRRIATSDSFNSKKRKVSYRKRNRNRKKYSDNDFNNLNNLNTSPLVGSAGEGEVPKMIVEEGEEETIEEQVIDRDIRQSLLQINRVFGRPQNFYGGMEIMGVSPYVMTMFVIVILVILGYAFLLFVQAIINIFTISISSWLTIILFLLEELVLYLFVLFLINISVIDWITNIILIAGYYLIVFVYASNISWPTFLIVNAITLIWCGGWFIVIWITRSQLKDLKIMSPHVDVTVYIAIVLITRIQAAFMIGNPGIFVYIYVPIFVALLLQFVDEVTEMYEGASGAYKQTSIITGMTVLIRLLFALVLTIITVIYTLKDFGFLIPIPIPWSPGYITINIPNTFFEFL